MSTNIGIGGLLAVLLLAAAATATYHCDNGHRQPGDDWLRPRFHFYPSTIESQDISAPIKVGDTWHVL